MSESGERLLVHSEGGYDFLIDTAWLFSVPRVAVKRGRLLEPWGVTSAQSTSSSRR